MKELAHGSCLREKPARVWDDILGKLISQRCSEGSWLGQDEPGTEDRKEKGGGFTESAGF